MIDQTRINTSASSRSTTSSRIPVVIRRHRSLSDLDLHRRRQQWSSSSSSYSHVTSSLLVITRKNHTQFKSNPYVGWFRHSPDTTMLKTTTSLFPRIPTTTTTTTSKKINIMKKQFSSLMKPQEIPIWKKQQQVFLSNVLMRNGGMNVLRRRLAREDLVAKFLQQESMLPKTASKGDYNMRQLTELLQNGRRLRGGGNITGSSILPLDPYDYHHYGKDINDDELNFDTTLSSSTAHLLTRFAYWLLLPFQDDEAAEEQDDDEHDDNENDNDTAADRHRHPQGNVDPTKNIPSSSSSCLSDDDDADSLDDYDYDPSSNQHNNLQLSPPSIDIGISSQAEAYYLHYSSSNRHQHQLHDQDMSRLDYVITQMDILRMQRNASRHLDVESIYQLPTQTYYSDKTKKNPNETNNEQQQQHQESISSCTTTTQDDDDCRDGHEESTRNNDQEESIITTMPIVTPTMTPAAEGWSWMLVPTTIPEDTTTTKTKTGNDSSSISNSLKGHGNNNNKDTKDCHRQEHDDSHVVGDGDDGNSLRLEPGQQEREEEEEEQEEQHVCVICLEHFVDGDRLRVLPCHHKFHVGCIDRWLSGSSSFQDCHTAGCPTCKKRPHVILSGYTNEKDMTAAAAAGDWSSHSDSSLPGWAFAQIGSVMAAASCADSIAQQNH